jgi:tetratricopeptide (TPR) repeat protein
MKRIAPILIALFLISSATSWAQSDSRALSLDDVMNLLKAGVTPTRVKNVVGERGVDFQLSGDVDRRLREAGASDDVILQIAKSYRTGSSPAPKRAPAPERAPADPMNPTDPSEQYELALRYQKGDGVPQSQAEAVRLFRRAGERGFAPAQNALGLLYEEELKDYGEALKWYRKAADQRDATGQANLGMMYSNGRGVPKDEAEAARLIALAAEQGHPKAQYNMGYRFHKGQGVPQDDVEAYKWFTLAAARGFNPGFPDYIRTLERKMPSKEVAEAKQRAREWEDGHRKR